MNAYMASLVRLRSLVLKEAIQIANDPSSILIAFVLPVLLLFLFGFAVSLDNTKVRIGVVLTDASPPSVKSVGLGNVNGVTLGYTPGTGQGNATATKDGSKYKISGTATGVDMANPMQPVNKPFEIDVTCP